MFVSSPVALPVSMTPSAKKNSAAFTVSDKVTSEVITCELQKFQRKIIRNNIFTQSVISKSYKLHHKT